MALSDLVVYAASAILEELGHAYNYTDGSGGSAIVYDGVFSIGQTYQVRNQTLSAGEYNAYQILTNCNK